MAGPTPIIPQIAPLQASDGRLFWSVIVPTRNPKERFLAAALDSVLTQDCGPDEMQIEVLDDFSDNMNVADWTAARYGARVTVYRGEGHRGMAGNWNAGIRRSRGRWLHILHDDDMVRPGFYQTLRTAIEAQSGAGAAFVFHHMIDGDGQVLRPCHISPRPAGVLRDWVEDVFVNLKIQSPSIVVRRSVYEALGGFDESYRYFIDWEMWQRVAASFPIWYEPTPLAFYREHGRGTSATATFSRDGVRELRRCIDAMRDLLPPAETDAILARAESRYAALWLRNAWRVLVGCGDLPRALAVLFALFETYSSARLARGFVQQLRGRAGH